MTFYCAREIASFILRIWNGDVYDLAFQFRFRLALLRPICCSNFNVQLEI